MTDFGDRLDPPLADAVGRAVTTGIAALLAAILLEAVEYATAGADAGTVPATAVAEMTVGWATEVTEATEATDEAQAAEFMACSVIGEQLLWTPVRVW